MKRIQRRMDNSKRFYIICMVILGVVAFILVSHALSGCASVPKYGNPGTYKSVGYYPYSPTFKIKHNACSQKSGY